MASMTDLEQKEFLINTMASLLQEAIVRQQFVVWLTEVVGVPQAGIDKVLKDIRNEVESNPDLRSSLQSILESALQSGEARYDLVLASALAQWNPKGKAN